MERERGIAAHEKQGASCRKRGFVGAGIYTQDELTLSLPSWCRGSQGTWCISLTTARKLKEKGAEVYFQRENIYTLDSKGELLITIMSSLAQEESWSISKNTTWGKRKQFADGKGSLAYSTFLGYEKGEDGSLKVDPEQAGTEKLIYQLFL